MVNFLLGSSSSAIRLHNLRTILLVLLRHQPVSRARIASLTGMSSTTVTNLVSDLVEQGIVAEDSTMQLKQQRGVGRPRTALHLVPDARHAVGVHIGIGRVMVAVTNLFAQPVSIHSHEFPLDHPPEAVLTATLDSVRCVVEESQVNPQMVVGIGVGASGLVDLATGTNILAPNLGWHEVPIREFIKAHLDWPVFVDNNVRAMAIGESLFGAGKDVGVLAFVYARVGVGAGFVMGGQLYRGGSGAGEIGHVTIMAEGGKACRCGNTGCLEPYVSELTFLEQAQAIARHEPDGLLAQHLTAEPDIEQIFAAAREGDAATLKMLQERARYMGIGLANLVNTLSPEVIMLGGIFAQGQNLLFPVVQETMRHAAFGNLGEQVRLLPPTFGQHCGVVGAAALALDAFFYKQSEVIA